MRLALFSCGRSAATRLRANDAYTQQLNLTHRLNGEQPVTRDYGLRRISADAGSDYTK